MADGQMDRWPVQPGFFFLLYCTHADCTSRHSFRSSLCPSSIWRNLPHQSGKSVYWDSTVPKLTYLHRYIHIPPPKPSSLPKIRWIYYPYVHNVLFDPSLLKYASFIPGLHELTHKGTLSASGLPFIPRSFRLPDDIEELRRHASQNPNATFLIKNKLHRGIRCMHYSSAPWCQPCNWIK